MRGVGGDSAGVAGCARRGALLTVDPDWLKDLFRPFGDISIRRMFGGAGLYRDGVMFGLESDGVVYLKSDETTRERFQEAGCRPFAFEKGGKLVTTSYWSLPDAALDDGEVLKTWADLAFATALRGGTAKKKLRKGKR